jgi:hypothetical protein
VWCYYHTGCNVDVGCNANVVLQDEFLVKWPQKEIQHTEIIYTTPLVKRIDILPSVAETEGRVKM